LYLLFGLFPELVRQTAADLDQSRYTCTGQGPTTFTKFWARSAKWGRNGGGGLKSVPDASFYRQYETTFRQLRNGRFSPNSATTRESWVKRRLRTKIYEKFPFRGHLPPKPQTLRGVKQVPHSEQATGQEMHVYSTL